MGNDCELPAPAMPIAAVEMQEYLFAVNLARAAYGADLAANPSRGAALERNIRETYRFIRFGVINWLLQNGVSIPAELLTDTAHPPVGKQFPDQRVTNR